MMGRELRRRPAAFPPLPPDRGRRNESSSDLLLSLPRILPGRGREGECKEEGGNASEEIWSRERGVGVGRGESALGCSFFSNGLSPRETPTAR